MNQTIHSVDKAKLNHPVNIKAWKLHRLKVSSRLISTGQQILRMGIIKGHAGW